MFARSAVKTASKQAFRSATFTTPRVAAPIQRAAFNSSSKDNKPEVPVVSYQDGQRTVETLNIPAGASVPVQPPTGDVQKAAIPLNPNVYAQLTPTLAKFTLPGKVAIVTG